MSKHEASSPPGDFTKTKACATLRLLTRREWRELEDWLRSPAATTRSAPLRAYHVLDEAYPDFDLDKATLYRAVYGKKAFDKATLNNLLSALNRLTEDFLILRRTRLDAARRAEALRAVYRDRGRLDAHYRTVTDLLKPTAATPPADEWDTLLRVRRYHDAYFYAPEEVLFTPDAALLGKTLAALDRAAALLRQKIEFEQATRRAVLDESTPPLAPAAPHPVDELYALLRAATTDDLPGCAHFEARYHARYSELTPAYRRLFGIVLFNRLIRLNGLIGTPAVPALLRHIRFLDTERLLPRNSYLMGTTYLNVIAIAILGEDYAYAEDLADRYYALLPTDRRAVVAATARARIAFAAGDFVRAAELANQPVKAHAQYEILRRMVAVKAGLEYALQAAPEDESWRYTIDNFEKYLRRNRYYSESRRTPFLRFCLLARQLGQALLPTVQPARLARIRAAVRAEQLYGEKWLLGVLGRWE